MPSLQEQDFNSRMTITDTINGMFVEFLKASGFLTNARRATKTEDMEWAIDLWIDRRVSEQWPIPLDNDPAQLKNRDKPGYRDVPVCRSQPFHGFDSEATGVGRDYKGLIFTRKTTQYLVVIKNDADVFSEIYRVSVAKLRPQVEALEQEWKETTNGRYVSQGMMTAAKKDELIRCQVWSKLLYASPTGQVWWQKNRRRESPKINFYLPENLKEECITIPEDVGLMIKERYDTLKAEAEAENNHA